MCCGYRLPLIQGLPFPPLPTTPTGVTVYSFFSFPSNVTPDIHAAWSPNSEKPPGQRYSRLLNESQPWAQGEADVSKTRPQCGNLSVAVDNLWQSCVLAPNSTIKLTWASDHLAMTPIPLSLCPCYSLVLKSHSASYFS